MARAAAAAPPPGRRRGGGVAFWVGLSLALLVAGGAAAGGIWYYIDQREQSALEAKRAAAEKAKLEAERARKAEEARRLAEAETRRKQEEARRKAAEAERLRKEREEAERRRKAEMNRLQGEEERDPNTNKNDNTNRNTKTPPSRDGTWRAKSKVLAPAKHAAILGDWCSNDYKIHLTRTNFESSNRRTNAKVAHKLVRYEFFKSHVRFHYRSAAGNPIYGVYEFQAFPGDPNKLRLTRTFYKGKWTARSSVYSRNCS